MIDYLHASIDIHIHHNSFEWMLWTTKTAKNGEIYYSYTYRNVAVNYHPPRSIRYRPENTEKHQ